MKKLILTLLPIIVLGLTVLSQDNLTTLVDSIPINEGVIRLEGKTKSEIYLLLREWTAINFVSANSVIQMDNEDAGKIIAKGIHTYHYKLLGVAVPNNAHFTLELDIKDNRFKYRLTITEATTGTLKTPLLQSVIIPDIPLRKNGKPGGRAYKKQRILQRGLLKEFIDSTVKSLLNLSLSKTSDW